MQQSHGLTTKTTTTFLEAKHVSQKIKYWRHAVYVLHPQQSRKSRDLLRVQGCSHEGFLIPRGRLLDKLEHCVFLSNKYLDLKAVQDVKPSSCW